MCGAQGAIFGVDVHQVLSNALVSLRASATGNVRRLVPDDDVTVNPQLHKDPNTNMGTIFESYLLLVEEIQLAAKQLRLVVYPCLSQYFSSFIHPRWCRISSINSRTLCFPGFDDSEYHVLFEDSECFPFGGSMESTTSLKLTVRT